LLWHPAKRSETAKEENFTDTVAADF